MIFQILTNNKTLAYKGWVTTTAVNTITKPEISESVPCFCNFVKDYEELAFVDTSNIDNNDYRTFYIRKMVSTSEHLIKMFKNGIECILTGIEYTSNPYQPELVEFRVNWKDVAEQNGYGKFYLELHCTDFGVLKIETSHIFNVVKFDKERAKDTVKLRFDISGLTINGKDWTGVKWDNMVRVHGRLGNHGYEIESESIETGAREIIEVQKSAIDTFVLKINFIPKSVSTFIIDELPFINWFVTTYNYFDHDNFKDIKTNVVSVEGEDIPNSIYKNFNVNLVSSIKKVHRKYTL